MALIHYLVPLQFDFGAIALLGAECGRVGIQRPLTTSQSASRAVHGEVKRGSHFMEPKAPQTCDGEAPTARSGFFTVTDSGV